MLLQRMRKHGLQQFPHLHAIPFARAEGHADSVAAGAHDERRRQSGHPPRLRGFEVGVEQNGKGEPEPADIGVQQWPRGVAIDRDAEDDEPAAPVLLPQCFERRHLGETRLAPRRPEVHDHELVLVIGEGGHAPIEPRQPQPGRPMSLPQLRDASPLERIKPCHMRRMMPPILSRPPHRQRPHHPTNQHHRENHAHELRSPALPEPKARCPALHPAR